MGHRFGVLTLLQKWVGVRTVNTCRWKFLWSGVNPEQSYRFQWSDCGFTPLCNLWQDCLGGNLMIGGAESRERLDEAACVPGKQHKRTDTQFYAFIKKIIFCWGRERAMESWVSGYGTLLRPCKMLPLLKESSRVQWLYHQSDPALVICQQVLLIFQGSITWN